MGGWIAILGPLLAQLAQSVCGKDPVVAAKEAYDPATDTFQESAIRAGIVQAHHAIRIDRKDMTRAERKAAGRIGKDEIRAGVISKMHEGLTATPETVAYCLAYEVPELDHDGDQDD